jgi:hypothetical protein
MIDTLIAFGCSNTQGDEAVADKNIGVNKEHNIFFAYPFFLSKKLGCKTYHNYAKVGASNYEIAATLLKNLDNYDPARTFVIIGWSDNNRIPVTTYTSKSYKILHKFYSTLPFLKKLQYYNIYKKLINVTDTKIATISKAIVRIAYARLFSATNTKGVDKYMTNLKDHEKYAYETVIAPYFNDDFILGLAKHVFNTQQNDLTNDLYRIAIESVLSKNGFKYFMLTTTGTYNHMYPQYLSNNYFQWKNSEGFISIVLEYGSKYGMSKSGAHMKALAHSKLADFLYSEIYQRGILL